MKGDESLNQYFTPVWVTERIVSHYYSNLTDKDVVFDIGCGDGRFLMALPDHVCAYGFEIDPGMASRAKINTGRDIIVGDFTVVKFPAKPTLFLGNPPYAMKTVNQILNRAYDSLDYGQEAGFLLPVYFFQTADTVINYSKKWTLKHDLIPRNIFQGMIKPLMFARFIKHRQTTMVNMFLYNETSDILSLKKEYRMMFLGNNSSTHLWGEAVDKALINLGGKGTTQEIYREIEGKRPTKTKYWKEQIRKVLQQFYTKVAPATYALNTTIT